MTPDGTCKPAWAGYHTSTPRTAHRAGASQRAHCRSPWRRGSPRPTRACVLMPEWPSPRLVHFGPAHSAARLLARARGSFHGPITRHEPLLLSRAPLPVSVPLWPLTSVTCCLPAATLPLRWRSACCLHWAHLIGRPCLTPPKTRGSRAQGTCCVRGSSRGLLTGGSGTWHFLRAPCRVAIQMLACLLAASLVAHSASRGVVLGKRHAPAPRSPTHSPSRVGCACKRRPGTCGVGMGRGGGLCAGLPGATAISRTALTAKTTGFGPTGRRTPLTIRKPRVRASEQVRLCS